MEYVAPIAAFLLFLGGMAVQARRRRDPPREVAAPTREQTRAARTFRAAMLVAWALLMVALIGGDDFLPLLIPAGAGFLAGGAAFQADAWGMRDALTLVDAQSFSARVFGARSVTPLWGILAMILGAGFLAGGIAAAVT